VPPVCLGNAVLFRRSIQGLPARRRKPIVNRCKRDCRLGTARCTDARSGDTCTVQASAFRHRRAD